MGPQIWNNVPQDTDVHVSRQDYTVISSKYVTTYLFNYWDIHGGGGGSIIDTMASVYIYI